MKILFICCCLEPGMDGVGDYTRRLAAEINAQGHSCWLLSLADPHVRKAAGWDFADAGRAITGLRLPATDSWGDRVRAARKFCESVAPDWISWQIVPYGFDSRGLSFGLGRRCREISEGYRNQVMFHEIWIGEAKQSPLKNKIIGKLQKGIIQDFLKKLRPTVVHTHTPLYRYFLSQLGCRVTLLPLFGNIPITVRSVSEWLGKKWPQGSTPFPAEERESWWIFVMFGSIHPGWNGEEFRREALKAARRVGKKCLLISIGRPGSAGEQILRELQEHDEESWTLVKLGQQSEEEISQCLLMADFGVSTLAPEYLSKSGTVAAMVEHGLPVIATRTPFDYDRCPPDQAATDMRNIIKDFDLESITKSKAESMLPAVARQFIGNLQAAAPLDS